MKIRFQQEIAVLWDTVYSFRVQYNPEYFREVSKQEGRDKAGVERILALQYDCPKALAPFFVYPKDRHAFMQRFLERQISRCHQDYGRLTMRFFYDNLQNQEEVVKLLFDYYFPGVPGEEAAELLASPGKLAILIRDSEECSEDVKSSLLAFFLNPGQVIQQLIYELMQRELWVRKLHGEQAEVIIALSQEFTQEHVLKVFGNGTVHVNMDLEDPEIEITASFVMLNDYIWFEAFDDKHTLMILGRDYQLIQEKDADQMTEDDLFNVAAALGEKNRFAMFELMHKQKIMTRRMLEDAVDMTGPNVSYHLSFFTRANLVHSVNNRRTIEYSINKETIRKLRKFLEQYEKDE
ncbi:MAG: helix-turn-helix transcriptional regulator [Clostridia bacterium]|nr:helix-turn-helix transcriptional regulator [Clostridia bacterium]